MLQIKSKSGGYTLVELTIGIFLIGVITTTFFTFANTSVNQYVSLHKDSILFADLATQSQRIANVLRGLTDITAADANSITVYAYFAPNDTYVSKINYYKNQEGTKLFADVTDMTANPPTGTEIPASKKTFTIIDNFQTINNLSLFTYLDSSNNALSLPIADLKAIKQIKVSLSVPSKRPVATSDTTMVVEVSLRNRKTNL